MVSNDATIFSLIRNLMNNNDVSSIISELQSYKGEESKYVDTIVRNLKEDLTKYKYMFDLILKIYNENPKVSFYDIYFKFLSTNNFERHRKFYQFLKKLVTTEESVVEKLTYVDDLDDNVVSDNYNDIISTLDVDTGLKLIRNFLSQRTLNFEEYYYQQYLSSTEKMKTTLENSVPDINALYYRYPWIPNAVVSKIYIASTNHDIDIFIDNSSPTYYKTKTWYTPNKLFYNFISNQATVRNIKVDEGISTLEFLDEKSNVSFSFHILYKLFKNDFDFSLMLLDESMFLAEKKFLLVDYDMYFDDYHVNMFLDDVKMFTQLNIEILLEFFNKAMMNIQSSYKVNMTVLQLPSFKGIRTLRDLARKIAEITIFLHLDSMSKSIFKKRLIRNYYQQNALFDLTIEEKLPEIVYDIENTEIVYDFLSESIESELFNIGESIYRLSRKSVFKQLPRKRVYQPEIKLSYMDEVDDYNYLYYNKKEKWFSLKEILNINDDEYVSDLILPRLKVIFNFENIKKSISKEEFRKKYNLIFELLEDVISEEELIENHSNLFLLFPEPTSALDEITPEVILPPPIVTPTPAPTPPPAPAPLPEEVVEEISTPLPSFSFDAPSSEQSSQIAPTLPVLTIEEVNPEPVKDGSLMCCCKCGKEKTNRCTSTYLHSSKDGSVVQCKTYCFDCLYEHTFSDF